VERSCLSLLLGFLQAVIFVVAISSVLTKMGNVLNVLAYALGFATGNVVGMLIENRLAIGHTLVTIISSTRGANIAERLRASGYAVTEISGRGKDGTVFELHASVTRRDVDLVETIVLETDPHALSQPKISARSGADSSGHKSTYKDKGTEMIPVPFLLDGQSSYSLSRSGGKRITSRIE